MNTTTKTILSAALIAVAGLGFVTLTNAPTQAATTVIAMETETVSFEIDGMTCAMCPITVRTAMNRVEGVESVEVDFDTKIAVVNFDPAITNIDTIAQASTDAGYPAHEADAPNADHDDNQHSHDQ